MEAYADWKYYSDKYLSGREAVIDAASFPFYALKASQEIRRYAGHSLEGAAPPDCVRLCCCEIAELLYSADKKTAENGAGVTSESIGSWSVSYDTAEQKAKALCDGIRASVYRWLSGTGLLYLGVERC